MKRLVTSMLVSGAVLAAGIVYLILLNTGSGDDSTAQAINEEPLPAVVVQELAAQDVRDTRVLTGRISAWESVTMSAETSGKIEWQGVEEGDRVSEGDELIRINTIKARAHHAQALAQAQLADQEFNRIQGLRAEGISSPRELDQANAEREAARASLRLAEIELEQSVIRASFDGIVDYLMQEEDEYVGVGTPLVRVVQIDQIKYLIGIPERDLPFFEEGDAVQIYIDAYPKRIFLGKIHQISTSADPNTLTFITEVKVPNDDGALRPGMMAKSILVRESYRGAIAIPLFAVMNDGDRRYVYVESGGTVQRRYVDVGFFEGDFIHVTSGLEPGDRLVVVGQRQLHDGAKVDVRDVVEQSQASSQNPLELL